uniref:Leucine-rich repeat-containing N-terminal plant-type domain-containing protein n=1 Tax=Ananas comosus var. bracteatus TaxID=296719 RepID=A0A6V7NPU2_ANACO|nr:unnamed protein product [Ananas comosus var. bracteatus]
MASFILSFLLLILGMQANRAMGCIERERNTLLSFKAGLTDPYNFLSSWEGRDCCKWMGVVCSNTTSHVVKLKLGNLSLSGFWAICGALLISKSLRYGYFNLIDTMYDRLYVAVALTHARLMRSGCMEVERNALLTLKSGLVDPQNFSRSLINNVKQID